LMDILRPQATGIRQQQLNGFSQVLLGWRLIGQQTVVFLFDHCVTLTTAFLQTPPVEHRDMPARIPNQPAFAT